MWFYNFKKTNQADNQIFQLDRIDHTTIKGYKGTQQFFEFWTTKWEGRRWDITSIAVICTWVESVSPFHLGHEQKQWHTVDKSHYSEYALIKYQFRVFFHTSNMAKATDWYTTTLVSNIYISFYFFWNSNSFITTSMITSRFLWLYPS